MNNESRPQNIAGKLCNPKPVRFICRIREFLSVIKRIEICKVTIFNYLLNTFFWLEKKSTQSISTNDWRAIFVVLLNFGKDAF